MKALLLAPDLFESEGGIARILRLYLKALCELAEPDGQVRLVSLNDVQFDTRELRTYASERLVAWNACGRDKLRFVRGALAEAASIDLLVCGHVAQLPVAWLCRRRNRKLRFVLVAHGFEVWRRFSLPERLALRSVHRVWCVSEYTRRRVLEFSGLPEARTALLPNALDPRFSPPAERPNPSTQPEPVILTISRLCYSDRYKGIDHLISALPGIRRKVPGTTLRVIGRGDDLPRLQGLAASAGVAEAVRFLGYIGDNDLRAELSRCRVFALPSEREGFGLVYLEAMAHGKPCVGANAGGIPEVIDETSGLLCPYGNTDQLAETCVAALQKDWDAAAIRTRAAHFSYDHFKANLERLVAA